MAGPAACTAPCSVALIWLSITSSRSGSQREVRGTAPREPLARALSISGDGSLPLCVGWLSLLSLTVSL